jgi:hypothetical protein
MLSDIVNYAIFFFIESNLNKRIKCFYIRMKICILVIRD